MRIRIVLDLKNKLIPINYRSILACIVYSMLPLNENTTILHNEGIKLNNRKFKLLTFSEIYGDTIYNKNKKVLLFHSSGCFDVTSFNDEIILNIVKYIEDNNYIIFKNQCIKIIKYDILNDFCNNNEKVTFYTVSPITIYKTINKFVKYYNPNEKEFKEAIINNIRKKYFLCYNRNAANFDILEIEDVVKKLVYFRNTIYEAYHLSITFKGLNPEIQKIIMTTGLGPKNALGFGMVAKSK